MMTTSEILNEIHRLPLEQQKDLKKRILEDNGSNDQPKTSMTQDEFDRVLFEDGFLANLPVEFGEDDDFMPVVYTGRPLSETIIQERR